MAMIDRFEPGGTLSVNGVEYRIRKVSVTWGGPEFETNVWADGADHEFVEFTVRGSVHHTTADTPNAESD